MSSQNSQPQKVGFVEIISFIICLALIVFAYNFISNIFFKSDDNKKDNPAVSEVSKDDEIYNKYKIKRIEGNANAVEYYAALDLKGDYKEQIKEIIPVLVKKNSSAKTIKISTDNIYKTEAIDPAIVEMNQGNDIWSDKEYLSVASYVTDMFSSDSTDNTIYYHYPILDGGEEKFSL